MSYVVWVNYAGVLRKNVSLKNNKKCDSYFVLKWAVKSICMWLSNFYYVFSKNTAADFLQILSFKVIMLSD